MADDGVGAETEQGVDGEADDDDVGLQELAGVVDHVAEAGAGADGLRDDQGQPGDAEALAQPGEGLRQRAGETTWRIRWRQVRCIDLAASIDLPVDAADAGEGVEVEREA